MRELAVLFLVGACVEVVSGAGRMGRAVGLVCLGVAMSVSRVREEEGLIFAGRAFRSRGHWEPLSIEIAGYTGYRITTSAGVSCICLFFSSIHPNSFFHIHTLVITPHRTPAEVYCV